MSLFCATYGAFIIYQNEHLQVHPNKLIGVALLLGAAYTQISIFKHDVLFHRILGGQDGVYEKALRFSFFWWDEFQQY